MVRIETNGVLRVLVSLEWDGIWEITGSWSNFWCYPAAALNGNEKRTTFALSFSLYPLGMAYTFVLFLVSCSWIRLPAPALAYIVFGTGVAYTLERCLICSCPGWTGFFLQIFCLALASIWSVGSWDICHDQIQRGFWDYGRPSSLVLHCSGRLHLCGYC